MGTVEAMYKRLNEKLWSPEAGLGGSWSYSALWVCDFGSHPGSSGLLYYLSLGLLLSKVRQ